MEIRIKLVKSGRKPVNPVSHPQALTVSVKIPVLNIQAFPKGPKDAINLNKMRISVGPPVFLKKVEKVKNFLKSKQAKEIKNSLRKKGLRGIKMMQASFGYVVRICPSCKEIGSPIIEWQNKEPKVNEKVRRMWDRTDKDFVDKELVLFFNHPKGSLHERCRICKVEKKLSALTLKPFPNSKIHLNDLRLNTVLHHILNKDPGYEKYSKIFNVRNLEK